MFFFLLQLLFFLKNTHFIVYFLYGIYFTYVKEANLPTFPFYSKNNLYLCVLFTKVNIMDVKDFISRLKIIQDYYSLTNSSIAEKMGVQASSITHLFSGRNNPSLDFVLKLIETFPEVDFYWLVFGKGSFPRKLDDKKSNDNKIDKQSDSSLFKVKENIDDNSNFTIVNKANEIPTKKDVKKIILFFDDNSFEIFEN